MSGQRLGIHGVRAVMIFSDDPGASCSWWGDLLDLPRHAEDGFHWLELPGGVELGFHPADETKNPSGASTVVYWQVGSLRAAMDSLTEAGGQLHRGPLKIEDGRWIAQVRDPFGVVMGIDGI